MRCGRGVEKEDVQPERQQGQLSHRRQRDAATAVDEPDGDDRRAEGEVGE